MTKRRVVKQWKGQRWDRSYGWWGSKRRQWTRPSYLQGVIWNLKLLHDALSNLCVDVLLSQCQLTSHVMSRINISCQSQSCSQNYDFRSASTNLVVSVSTKYRELWTYVTERSEELSGHMLNVICIDDNGAAWSLDECYWVDCRVVESYNESYYPRQCSCILSNSEELSGRGKDNDEIDRG